MAAKQVRRAPRRGLPPTRAFIGVLRRERGLLHDFTEAQGGREPTFWFCCGSKTSESGFQALWAALKKRAPGRVQRAADQGFEACQRLFLVAMGPTSKTTSAMTTF